MLKIFLNSKNQQFLVKHKKIDCYLTQTNRHFHPNLYVRQLPQRLSFRTVKTSYSQLFYILCRSVQGTCNWIFINVRFNDILQQLTMLIKSGKKTKRCFHSILFTLTIGIVNVTINIHSITKLIITTKWAKRLTTWKCILCELNVEKGLRAPLSKTS